MVPFLLTPRQAGLLWPCEGYLGQPWGYDPTYKGNRANFHYGLDVKAWEGTPVYAPADCEAYTTRGPAIVTGVSAGAWGNFVRFTLADGGLLDYCHLVEPHVLSLWEMTQVKRGQLVGYVGETGLTFGPHLHIQAWPSLDAVGDGRNRINPLLLPWDLPHSRH